MATDHMCTHSSSVPPNSLVFVIDDDDAVRRSLTRLFRASKVAAEAFASANAYLDRELHSGPSCLVLDVRMPNLDGMELQQKLLRRDAQIVFITGHGDIPMCADAMKAGAVDFLTKPVDAEELLSAVRRGLERSQRVFNAMTAKQEVRALLDRLTPREFEVMQHVIAGLLNKQIANQLGAAEKTIKIHRGQVMRKMEAVSVAELVRIAQIAGVSPVSNPVAR